jgi:hypothetical protein
LRFEVWANELTDRLVSRIRDTADNGDWQGPWWLLQGLASIGSDGLGGWAEEQAAKAAVSLPAGWQGRTVPPDRRDPAWYLFDIDVSGSFVLAGAGVFDEADQAAEAWRAAVGISAEGLTPEPLTPDALTCLTYFGSEERDTYGDESRMLLDNWFRAPRRISDLIRTLAKRGVALPPYRSLYEDIEALASEWLEGIMPGTEHAVSPGRSAYYRRLISTDWLDDPVTAQVLAVLPEWVRWHGEQSGLPAHLLDIAVKAAQADSAWLG